MSRAIWNTVAAVPCWLLAAGTLASALLGVAPANADPGCTFHDQRLCDPSKVYYCPDTGTMVTWLAPCPALVIGPHRAGMPDDG